MRPRQSHMSAPLTKLTSIKINFKWTQVKQGAFEVINQIAARDTFRPELTHYRSEETN